MADLGFDSMIRAAGDGSRPRWLSPDGFSSYRLVRSPRRSGFVLGIRADREGCEHRQDVKASSSPAMMRLVIAEPAPDSERRGSGRM
jgi:hypothetical protein